VENDCVEITPCQDSLDCRDDDLGRTICDEDAGECVECTTSADCPENHDCESNRCRAYAPCVNSLDCPPSMVCDTIWGRCLDCVRNEDCREGEICVAAACRLGCDSDNDCTPHGLLCNHLEGYCAQCLSHVDCAEQLFCSLGNCVRDVCRADSRICQDNAIMTCTEAGDTYLLTAYCGSSQTCVETPPAAACEDWVCSPPGDRTCTNDHERLIDCADDGLSFETVENCASNDELCVVDACLPVVCIPSEQRCDGDDRVLLCSSDGTSEAELDDCQTDEYCDGADATCKAQVCVPDQPACNGNVATTCNARGNDYLGGGTDCDATTDVCASGACSTLMDAGTTSTYYSGTRGFWFEAPTDFTITGLRVPAGSLSIYAQSIQVIRFNSAVTPGSPVTSANFTNLHIEYYLSGTDYVEVDIDVSEGDEIGILGTRSAYYQTALDYSYPTEIDGQAVTLYALYSSSAISASGVTSVTPYNTTSYYIGIVEMLYQ
jgi:hypothetical protein